MDDVAKYKLELKSKDETYTRCRIGGLDMAYMKCSWSKNPDQLETFGGICGLIRCKEYPGYCFLCMTYHKQEDGEFAMPNYIIDFSPLYNKEGQMILIEYDHDDICTAIDRGYKDYYTNKWVDCELTFWNNGCFDEFRNK
jgi:hypothetical protein